MGTNFKTVWIERGVTGAGVGHNVNFPAHHTLADGCQSVGLDMVGPGWSATTVLPDAEAITVRILKAATVAGGRIFRIYLGDPTFPMIVMHQAGADLEVGMPPVFEAARVQRRLRDRQELGAG